MAVCAFSIGTDSPQGLQENVPELAA